MSCNIRRYSKREVKVLFYVKNIFDNNFSWFCIEYKRRFGPMSFLRFTSILATKTLLSKIMTMPKLVYFVLLLPHLDTQPK